MAVPQAMPPPLPAIIQGFALAWTKSSETRLEVIWGHHFWEQKMSKLKLKCGIRVAPFLCQSRHLGTTALAALFFLLAGLALLSKAAWCGYSGACTFTLEDHVLLIVSFALFNLFSAVSFVVYVFRTTLRILNLVEEDKRIRPNPDE
jgi:hypothetical protein